MRINNQMKLYWSELEWRWNEMSMKFYDILNLFNCFFFVLQECLLLGWIVAHRECYLYEIEIRTHKSNQIKSLFYVSFEGKKSGRNMAKKRRYFVYGISSAQCVSNARNVLSMFMSESRQWAYLITLHTQRKRERAHTTFHIICGIEIKIKRVHFGFNEFSCKKIDFLLSVFHC